MNNNLTDLALEINNLVTSFYKSSQAPKVEYGKSVKEILLEKFKPLIFKEALNILQKLSDNIWDKTGKPFGYYEIDSHVAIKNGNVVLGFVLSPNLRTNQDNNQLFVKELNRILPSRYNSSMTKTIKAIKDVPSELSFVFFQIKEPG